MEITLRPFDYGSKIDLGLMARWMNDLSLKHLSSVNRSDADYSKIVGPGDIKERAGQWSWMCLADGVPIGECSLQFDAPHGLHKEPKTAWFGIILGEESARGRGLGAQYFTLLEEESQRLGALQAELGVFAFNTRAIRLYERLGYTKLGEVADFTWFNGQYWPDVRYFKRFEAKAIL